MPFCAFGAKKHWAGKILLSSFFLKFEPVFQVNSVRFGLPAVSTILCVIGTFANLTSLVYFTKKKDKTIGDKILMLLNSVDLLLCFCATVHTAILTYMILTIYQGVNARVSNPPPYNLIFSIIPLAEEKLEVLSSWNGTIIL